MTEKIIYQINIQSRQPKHQYQKQYCQDFADLFQNFHLLPKLTALDNVALPLSYAGIPLRERKRMARKAPQKVGLEDRVDFMPNQLSGGQKQRVPMNRPVL